MSNFNFDALEDILSGGKKPAEEPRKNNVQNFLESKNVSKMDDISKVKVPNSFIDMVLGNKPKLVESKVVEVEDDVEDLDEARILEEKINSLVSRLASLLKEAKEVMAEMTTVGMIGTNQKFSLKKKKKNGPAKANSRN